MPQSFAAKKRAIATSMVQQSGLLLDAADELKGLVAEITQVAEGGAFFTDAQLEYSGLEHLTPFLLAKIVENVGPDFQAWLDAVAYVGGPTRRQIFLQVRPGG